MELELELVECTAVRLLVDAVANVGAETAKKVATAVVATPAAPRAIHLFIPITSFAC